MNKWILLILSLLLLSACEKDEPVPELHISERAVLVWLAGDNNMLTIVHIAKINYLCIA